MYLVGRRYAANLPRRYFGSSACSLFDFVTLLTIIMQDAPTHFISNSFLSFFGNTSKKLVTGPHHRRRCLIFFCASNRKRSSQRSFYKGTSYGFILQPRVFLAHWGITASLWVPLAFDRPFQRRIQPTRPGHFQQLRHKQK
ncbi:hypothetical protein PMIN03_000302 [Paraphaeosphaeria minitans]